MKTTLGDLEFHSPPYGPGSCGIGPIHLMAGWRKRRLEPGFSFVEFSSTYRLAVWLSGNALASINVVALRQTRLVPGWVTVCGRVNHLGM